MREMKDSSVEWLDEIPKTWSIAPLKTEVSFAKGLPITKENLVEKGVAVVSYGQIHSKNNAGSYLKEELVRYVSEDYLNTNPDCLAEKGDIFVADTSEDYDGIGNAVLIDWDRQVFAGYHTVIIRPENKRISKYLSYLFMTDAWRSQMRSRASGIKVFSVTQGLLKKTSIIVPSEDCIQRITDYLDSKCSKIDEIIAKQEKIIEKLKEYKLSVITEAVTKGLDPNVEMKDSGDIRLGFIPSNWDKVKITRILDYSSTYPIGDGDHGLIKTDDYKDEGIPYLRVQNLGWGTDLLLENIVYISEEDNEKIKSSELHPGDVLFCKTGATIGKTGMIPNSLSKANTTSHVGKVSIDKKYNSRFVFYYLSSQVGYEQFWDIACMKSTRPELSIEEIKGICVGIPRKRNEQDSIVEYLDKKCYRIDNLIKKYTHELNCLVEYKKSLIYEVVTGKKEV